MPKVNCSECGAQFYKATDAVPCPRCGKGGSAPKQPSLGTSPSRTRAERDPENESTKALRAFNGILLALNTLGGVGAFTLGLIEESFAFFVISIALVFGGLFGFLAIRVLCEIAEDIKDLKG